MKKTLSTLALSALFATGSAFAETTPNLLNEHLGTCKGRFPGSRTSLTVDFFIRLLPGNPNGAEPTGAGFALMKIGSDQLSLLNADTRVLERGKGVQFVIIPEMGGTAVYELKLMQGNTTAALVDARTLKPVTELTCAAAW